MTIVWAGLTTGALYCLIAIGYNIVLLASGAFNFAYAGLLMLGTYMVYVGSSIFHLPIIGTTLFAGATITVAAVVEERVAIAPIMARKDDHPEAALITTVGIGVILDGLVAQIFGSVPRSLPLPLDGPTLYLLGGTVGQNDLLLIGLVLVLGVGLHIWSRKTIAGLTSLAASEDLEAARARGINTRRLATWAFAMSGAVAGLFAVVVGAQTLATPSLADSLGLFGFLAIVIGGAGSQLGGLIGGFVVGLVYAFAERYTNTDWPNVIVYLVFLLILLIRPRGIFSAQMERQV